MHRFQRGDHEKGDAPGISLQRNGGIAQVVQYFSPISPAAGTGPPIDFPDLASAGDQLAADGYRITHGQRGDSPPG